MEAAAMTNAEMKRGCPYLRSGRARFLNFVFKGARPLGVSWKDFYESAGRPKTAKHNKKPLISVFKELTQRVRRNFSMEQDDRAWLVQVATSKTYPQYYIARSASESDAIEAVTKHCLLGDFNKARTAPQTRASSSSLEQKLGMQSPRTQILTKPFN
jgi:hypothetical protein